MKKKKKKARLEEERKARLEEELRQLEEEKIKNKCKTKKLEAEAEAEAEADKKRKLQQNDVLHTYCVSYHPKEPGKLTYRETEWKKGKITLNSNNIIFTPEDNSNPIAFNYDIPVQEEKGLDKDKGCTDRDSIRLGKSEKSEKCLIFIIKNKNPIIRFNNRVELEDFMNNRKKIKRG